MNFEQARSNMVEQQIRPWEVLDHQVLDLVGRLPREDFVPHQYRELAFTDMCIPLIHGQFMMSPKFEARALQALSVLPGDSVLEIGTGSGYFTILLASLAAKVCSIDIFDDFTALATTKLGKHGFNNVHLESGDAAEGYAILYDHLGMFPAVRGIPLHLGFWGWAVLGAGGGVVAAVCAWGFVQGKWRQQANMRAASDGVCGIATAGRNGGGCVQVAVLGGHHQD